MDNIRLKEILKNAILSYNSELDDHDYDTGEEQHRVLLNEFKMTEEEYKEILGKGITIMKETKEIVIMSKLPISEYSKGSHFVNFRKGCPQFTFSEPCKRLIKSWNKKFMKIVVKPEERIIEFSFSDDPKGFNVYNKNSWIKGAFANGFNTVVLKRELLSMEINYQRLYLEANSDKMMFTYKF